MPKQSNEHPFYPFPADHIIALISEQYPERDDLIRAIRLCNDGQWESPAYVHFVNRSRPNEEGSEWQFDENIILESDQQRQNLAIRRFSCSWQNGQTGSSRNDPVCIVRKLSRFTLLSLPQMHISSK